MAQCSIFSAILLSKKYISNLFQRKDFVFFSHHPVALFGFTVHEYVCIVVLKQSGGKTVSLKHL